MQVLVLSTLGGFAIGVGLCTWWITFSTRRFNERKKWD